MHVELVQEDMRVVLPGRRQLIGSVIRPSAIQRSMPGVLLLHEVGGINPSLLATARAFATLGFVVFVPDLYAGIHPWLGLARLAMGVAVNPLRGPVLRELQAALRSFGARADVDATHLGVVGYSVGGAYALQLACIEPSLSVAALFCGQLPRPIGALRTTCPVVASYAGRDFTCRGIPARLDRALSAYGIEHEVKTYPAAAHAFYDPLGPMFDELAARDAWERTLGFMRPRLSTALGG